jgi:mono/diheme cytochrome c family protein
MRTGTLKVFAGLLLTIQAASAQTVSPEYDFNRDIRPVLSGKCFKCHGPDAEARKADLRLDQRKNAVDRKAIVPGSPDESLLIERIMTSDPDDRMPPKGEPLSPAEIEAFRAWVKAGASYDQHWAYVKPVSPKLPQIDRSDWRRANPIDHFVQRRLIEQGLQPSPPAEPAVLLRRLSLDLVGLPPTVEEVTAFENDPSEKAYESAVNRLLDSRHFGEKWAAGWLDLARYADSTGSQHDDQFTIEQLAGDLLPSPGREQLVATGFHRNPPSNFAGGSKVDEVRADILHDRVSTTGQVWLGMTLECCQCHDHKFDPVSQADYYGLYAYFNQAIPELAMEGPGMFRKKFIGADLSAVASREDELRIEAITGQIALETAALQKARPLALERQAEWEKEFLASGRGNKIP